MASRRDWKGQDLLLVIWDLEMRKVSGKSFSKTKSTFKGRKYYEYFGKDRRLCKIEANAIIYSSWETFMLQTIFISFSNLRKIFLVLAQKNKYILFKNNNQTVIITFNFKCIFKNIYGKLQSRRWYIQHKKGVWISCNKSILILLYGLYIKQFLLYVTSRTKRWHWY